jgi:hypothetical protein
MRRRRSWSAAWRRRDEGKAETRRGRGGARPWRRCRPTSRRRGVARLREGGGGGLHRLGGDGARDPAGCNRVDREKEMGENEERKRWG